MANLEMLEKTKECLEALANGKNPNDYSEIPEDDKVITLKVVRCLYCALDAVNEQIEAEKRAFKKKIRTESYLVKAEQLSKFSPSDDNATITGILNKLKQDINDPFVKFPSSADIVSELLKMGMLEIQVHLGNKYKVATNQGKQIGISSMYFRNARGFEYIATLYNKEAQQFVVDNVIPVLLEGKA